MSKRITLSFDNGPTPGVTDEVLDVLAQHGVLTSFFVIGENLRSQAGRDCAERAAREGHWIGNHTMTHTVLFGSSDDPDDAEKEVAAAQAQIGDLAHPDRFFRPFAGGGILDRRVLNPRALNHLQRGGYTTVLWNSIPQDWDQPDRWVDNAMADVAAQDWTVVVIHDIDTGAMRHLPEFLRRLGEEGVDIVQEFPEACVPMHRGELRTSLDHLMPLTRRD
jgi:peptidoglycan/xylan/chitin deacetylase (PgdA/CDA1 family)